MLSNNLNSPYTTYPPYSPASTTYSPADNSVSTSSMTTTNQPRQRLRPWLIDQINSGKIPGLVWIDKDKMIFKIPWKHFGRPGVNEYNDAMLFRNWALHTKKYQHGEPKDISTWKTRFRCALHKLPDIDELNDLNQTDGDDPFRVYRFKKKEIEAVSSSASSSVGSPLSLPQGENPVVLSPLPNYSDMHNSEYSPGNTSVYSGYQMQDDVDLITDDLDLPNIDELEDLDLAFMQNDPQQISRYNSSGASVMNQPSVSPNPAQMSNMPNPVTQLTSTVQPQSNHLQNQQQMQILQQQQQSPSALIIKLYYSDREVGEKVVDNPRGLRIAFNPPPPLPDDVVKEETSEVVSHIFGPFQAEQIYFPPANDESTMSILECIKRGLVLQARNGEVLATRLCRARVFYSDSVSPTEPVKDLPREHTTVIFDYANDFLPKLRNYMMGQGPKPTYERYFSFGQKWSHVTPLKNNYVYMSVTHCYAQRQIFDLNKSDVPILISDPNMLDIIAKQIEDLSINTSVK